MRHRSPPPERYTTQQRDLKTIAGIDGAEAASGCWLENNP
jgi:hypothetical protein